MITNAIDKLVPLKLQLRHTNMENVPVTIIVKAPNQQFEDQTIKCEISWTIKRLKNYLSEVYPNKPVSI